MVLLRACLRPATRSDEVMAAFLRDFNATLVAPGSGAKAVRSVHASVDVHPAISPIFVARLRLRWNRCVMTSERGPVCDRSALINVITATVAALPPFPAITVVVRATEPSWVHGWGVIGRWCNCFAASAQLSWRGDVVPG